MNINFIITCYDKEEYLPYLQDILNSYKKIKATYTVVYTGNNEEFSANIVIPNRGHSKGDYDCMTRGYLDLKSKNVDTRYIKIGIDSWLLDEDKLIEIFNKMEESQCGYSGIWWDSHKDDISTDIFFVDTRFGNIFEKMLQVDVPDSLIHRLEVYMYNLLNLHNIKIHFLLERWPTWSQYRWQCPTLGWTMSHDLQENINFLNEFRKNESSNTN
jgi:hypothetical protein